MAITQAMCTSFKKELLEAKHKFTTSSGHTFKLALYTNGASLDATTATYTTSNEVSSTNTNYGAGGQALAILSSPTMPASTGTTAFVGFADEVFSSVTLTARGAMIYNSTTAGGTNTTNAVAILDFGADKSATSGDFTVVFPAANASNAIIRLATPS